MSKSIINNLQPIMENLIGKIYTALPAEVISVDEYSTNNWIDVKPLITPISKDGVIEGFTVLQDVPVMMLGGGGALVSVPLQPGDHVLLIFNMYDINRWKAGDGSETQPDTRRKHNINDAVAIPGLFSKGSNLTPSPNSLEIKYKGSSISIPETGKIQISAPGQEIDLVAGTANIKATNVHLGEGGSPIAREGDTVEVEITSGSSAGTYTGIIKTGSTNNTSI